MRKPSAKKESDKSENKARNAKIKVVRGLAGEKTTKKESVKKVKPKTAEKKKAKTEMKVGAKVVAKKEKRSAVPIVPKVKAKGIKKTKGVAKKPASESKRKSGPIRIKALSKKEDKVSVSTSPKGPAMGKRSAKAVTKAKADNKNQKKTQEKSAKPARTVSPLDRGKVPVGKLKEIESKQPAEKERKKPKVKIEVKQQKPGKYEKAAKMRALEALNKLKTIKTTEIPERKVKAVTRKKRAVLPATKEKSPTIPLGKLPSEYGENGITLMPVDPFKLFVFWEMTEDTRELCEGEPMIRVYDINETEISPAENTWVDIVVSERIGERYIDVHPARVFMADIGIMSEGIFIAVARSRNVSTPAIDSALKGEAPKKFHETGTLIGYE